VKSLTILGARPQFIKAAPLSMAAAHYDDFEDVIVHTGQHYDVNMSDVFFEELNITQPKHHLGVSGGTHGSMTGRMMETIEQVLMAEKPDVVVIYGDTNSTLAGAITAAKLHIPVAHVEAGLRSFNRLMPEEVNRVLSDHCSDLLLPPTDTATQNLQNEGIDASKILQVGDVMYDAALKFKAALDGANRASVAPDVEKGTFVLSTIHRQENTDHKDRLEYILTALAQMAADRPVLLPLHPRTKGRIETYGLTHFLAPLTLLDPLGYLDMLQLERDAAVIATDSGGIQKEAFFHKTPCVTLRDETEWTELVDAGWNTLVPPTSVDAITTAVTAAIGSQGRDVTPYGSGDASNRIITALRTRYGS
jgi:UDP-GlcNAc3NAcA epimerase